MTIRGLARSAWTKTPRFQKPLGAHCQAAENASMTTCQLLSVTNSTTRHFPGIRAGPATERASPPIGALPRLPSRIIRTSVPSDAPCLESTGDFVTRFPLPTTLCRSAVHRNSLPGHSASRTPSPDAENSARPACRGSISCSLPRRIHGRLRRRARPG